MMPGGCPDKPARCPGAAGRQNRNGRQSDAVATRSGGAPAESDTALLPLALAGSAPSDRRYFAFSAARPALAASVAIAVRSPTDDASMHQPTGYLPLGRESTSRWARATTASTPSTVTPGWRASTLGPGGSRSDTAALVQSTPPSSHSQTALSSFSDQAPRLLRLVSDGVRRELAGAAGSWRRRTPLPPGRHGRWRRRPG